MEHAQAYSPAAASRSSRAGWAAALHVALFSAFMAYVFVGTQPFAFPSIEERVAGNPLDRVAVFSLVILALGAFALDLRRAGALVRANLGLLVVVGVCVLSVAWSDYPGLTVRRAALLAMLAVCAAGVAVGVTDLRRFHAMVLAALTAAVALNLVATALFPALAITDIGVAGLYGQKNIAGIVAMLAVIAAATWILGTARGRFALIGLAALALALFFLIITRSKTSIALGGLALGLMAAFALAERLGPRFVLALLALGIAAAAALVVGLAAVDFEPVALVSLFTGDPTFTGRNDLWRFAIDAALQRPVLGYGYGAFWDVGPGNDPLLKVERGGWLGDVSQEGLINQAHNGYLELFLHIGVPATIAATVVVLRRAWRSVRLAADLRIARADRAAIGMLALILIIHLLHNMTEATLFMRGAAFCNMALLAILVSSLGSRIARPAVR